MLNAVILGALEEILRLLSRQMNIGLITFIVSYRFFNIANVIFGQKRTKAAIILLRATGVTITFG